MRNVRAAGADRLLAAAGALAFAACTQSVISGSQHAASTSGSTTAGSGTAASTASAGTSSGAATTSGGATSSGGATNSGGSTGASGGFGGSTGASTRDAGPCLPLGTGCASNPSCCSGSCDVTCLEPEGQQCSGPSDCSSQNCVEEQCRCESNSGQMRTACGVSADCCNGLECAHALDDAGTVQTGACCDPTVTNCESDSDCCGTICVNKHCGCLLPNDPGCQSDHDCCGGSCIQSTGFLVGDSFCRNGSDAGCDSDFACIGLSCANGKCASCSATSGPCATSSDCCGDRVCADFSVPPSPYNPGSTDAGLACCEPNGGTCDSDAGINGDAMCCSKICTDFACACDAPGDPCYDDQGCCSGECDTGTCS